MSFNAEGFAYSSGFRNPSGLLPAATSSSLSSATMLAEIGVAQEVPATVSATPPFHISTFSAWAEISGNPRPVLVYNYLGRRGRQVYQIIEKQRSTYTGVRIAERFDVCSSGTRLVRGCSEYRRKSSTRKGCCSFCDACGTANRGDAAALSVNFLSQEERVLLGAGRWESWATERSERYRKLLV